MGDEIVDRCHRCSLDRDPFGFGVVSLPAQCLGQEAADGRAETLLADVLELAGRQGDVAATLTRAAAAYDRKGATAAAEAVRGRLTAE